MNEMAKKKESTPGENLAKQIIAQYNPKSVADMQNALKDIFGPMLQGEMNSHLGYESNDHGAKSTNNCRNDYTNKKINTSSCALARQKFFDFKNVQCDILIVVCHTMQNIQKVYQNCITE